ncbi:MAG: peptidoglycan-associated lipoprotein Pal [Proteobacteria bacterium]|nr:peptidoglycan-associated lipoprotein Pal [Pseudomonadota bacterium]
MKYLTIFFAFAILISYGCAQKAVQLSPTEQKQVQALQRGEDILKDRNKKTDITEEELARRDKAREWSLEEIKKSSPLKDIYFEFDSYIIKSDYFPKLNEIGNWLKQYKNIKVTIEGHCDERGTIEYNLALGQKRAEVVKNYLIKLGVEEASIKAISFGKELPADSSHGEDAWAKNRRASFRIDQKG